MTTAEPSSTDVVLGGTTPGTTAEPTPTDVVLGGNNILVTNTNDSGAGSLRQAVLNANATAGAKTILFQGSTFSDRAPVTIQLTSGELLITNTITLMGTGADQLTISSNNRSRVFYIQSGATVVLNDLTIADGNAGTDFGGGINNQGNLTLNNSLLIGNYAEKQGAAIWNSGSLTVTNSTFRGNTTDDRRYPGVGGSGGGIFNTSSGTVNVTNSTFTQATVRDGGGIFNYGGSVMVSGSTFSNSQVNGGGGIFNVEGTVAIQNSTINGNRSYGWGAGLWNTPGSTMLVSNSTISSNSSGVGGGGIWNEGGNLTLNTTTMINNQAGTYGGGLWSNGEVTVSNSTITGNSADLGAEVHIAGGTFTSGGHNQVGQYGNAGGFPTTTTDIVLADAVQTAIPATTDAVVEGTTTGPTAILATTDAVLGGTTTGSTAEPTSTDVVLGSNILVTNTNDSGAGSLRQAVLNANASAGAKTIVFQGSTFSDRTPVTIELTSGELIITNTITMMGTGANQLTISGNNRSRVFYIPVGTTVVLNDLTIAHGNAGSDFGGGINNQGNLTLNNCILMSNYAQTQGAGIWNNNILMVNHTTFQNNSTSTSNGSGGGIFNSGGTVTVNDSDFTGASVRDGGGIFNHEGEITVSDSTFNNNRSNGGGGIFNVLGAATIVNCMISVNRANGWGGGLRNTPGSTMTLSNSTVSDNSSGVGGGGICNERGTLTIISSTITDNRAACSRQIWSIWSTGGGGIWSDGEVTVSHSTIMNNKAAPGADIYIFDGTFTSGGHNQFVKYTGRTGPGFPTALGFLTTSTDIVHIMCVD